MLPPTGALMNVKQPFALMIKTPPIRNYTLATYKSIIAATFKRGWARSPLRLSREATLKATLSKQVEYSFTQTKLGRASRGKEQIPEQQK